MGTIFFSIILVSGYLFSVNALPVRYKFKRSEGWGSYFFVAAWGLLFFAIGWVLCSVINCTGFPARLAFILGMDRETAMSVIPFTDDSKVDRNRDLQIVTWAFISFALAFLSGLGVRWWFAKAPRQIAALINAARINPIEEIAIEASATMFPLFITLKSKKVYAGWVRKPALEHGEMEYISLIPLLSGHRSAETQKVTFTVNYNEFYTKNGVYDGVSRVTLEKFRVVIPVREIDNISLFDFETYQKFQRVPEPVSTGETTTVK